jgi:hypothetical protein
MAFQGNKTIGHFEMKTAKNGRTYMTAKINGQKLVFTHDMFKRDAAGEATWELQAETHIADAILNALAAAPNPYIQPKQPVAPKCVTPKLQPWVTVPMITSIPPWQDFPADWIASDDQPAGNQQPPAPPATAKPAQPKPAPTGKATGKPYWQVAKDRKAQQKLARQTDAAQRPLDYPQHP